MVDKDRFVNFIAVFLGLVGVLLVLGASTGQVASVSYPEAINGLMTVSAFTMAAAAFIVCLGLWRSKNWALVTGKLYVAALIVFNIVFMNVSDSVLVSSHSGWLLIPLEIGALSYLVYLSGIKTAAAFEYPPGMLG
ncbi:MAG TPA: hypothetical protein ACFCUC_12225 [Desulfobacterales bacterium]